MSIRKAPPTIAIVALLYVGVGVVGLIHHFPPLQRPFLFSIEDLWIELTELLALIAGIFLFFGQNWARWLAFAWIGFHVGLSFFDAYRGLAAHIVLCAIIGWLLFRPAASKYFCPPTAAAHSG